MVEVGIHKALEIALFVAHRRREAGERHPGGAHVLYRLDLGGTDAPAGFLDHVVDHRADLRPDQPAPQPRFLALRLARPHPLPAARRSEEQTSELQYQMRPTSEVYC